MGSPRNLYSELVVQSAVDAAGTGSAFATIDSFDRLNGGNAVHDLVAALVVAAVTTGPSTVTMVESETTDVASAMTAVSDDDVQGSNPLVLTTDNDNAVHYLGYLGDARFVGFTIDGTGSLGANVLWAAGNPRGNIR
jgi:hypothetical protein